MPKPLRIAFVCSSTSWGGLEMNVLRFCQWMSSIDYQTTLWCVEGSPLFDHAVKDGLEPFIIKRHRKYADLRAAMRLASRLVAEQIDVVWIRDTRDMSLMFWVKLFSKRTVKVVYQQAMQLGVSKRDFIHTQRFKAIDLWIAPLEYLRDQVISHTRFPKERIHVIPLAVDLSDFTDLPSRQSARHLLNLPESGLFIGNIGRIDPLKGQLTLIRAFARKQKEASDLNLLIMGDPTRGEGEDYLHELHAECALLDVRDHVYFLPHQTNVALAYAAIDIFVMASAGETFGMVTIEALAAGCAVIGTNTSGTPELLGYGAHGLLFSPNDEATLAEHLGQLIASPAVRGELSSKGRIYAHETFSIAHVRESLVNAIDSIN